MPSQRRIPWNRRLGKIGELAIEKRLSYFSNPMKPTFDIGIDFWCELTEGNASSPRIFLVQAKGTEHFDEKWGRSFYKETIDFWLNQFYPVYIIVYDEKDKNCYWMSIEEHRKNLTEKMRSLRKKTVYITMDRSNVLRDGQNNEFIRRVKQDWASIDFRLSLIQGVPKLIGEGYVKRRPLLFLSKELVVNIHERIRISMNYLITHYLLKKELARAYSLSEVLTKFDKGHYDHFVLFGRICKSLGKLEVACSSYKQAIDICTRDKNWNKLKKPWDPSIEDIIASIRKEMKSINCDLFLKKKE